MSAVRVVILSELPAGRSCSANTDTGRCSCGWQAPDNADTTAATMEHLYGDLTGRAREFAYRGFRE